MKKLMCLKEKPRATGTLSQQGSPLCLLQGSSSTSFTLLSQGVSPGTGGELREGYSSQHSPKGRLGSLLCTLPKASPDALGKVPGTRGCQGHYQPIMVWPNLLTSSGPDWHIPVCQEQSSSPNTVIQPASYHEEGRCGRWSAASGGGG